MNFRLLFLKKENFTSEKILEKTLDKGDRWTFMGILPESSYIHTVKSGQRTQEKAQEFIQQIKDNSDGKTPYFESDGWF